MKTQLQLRFWFALFLWGVLTVAAFISPAGFAYDGNSQTTVYDSSGESSFGYDDASDLARGEKKNGTTGNRISFAKFAGFLAAETALPKGGTYILRDLETRQVMRIGRTRNLIRREAEHARDPNFRGFQFEVVDRTDSYVQQRGLEQLLHEKHNPPLNKINPISPTNPNRQEYLDAAQQFLQGGQR